MDLIVPSHDVDQRVLDSGGKGRNLHILQHHGLPVPDFFSTPPFVHKLFLKLTGLDIRIAAILATLDFGNHALRRAAADEIEQLILGAKVPFQIDAAIQAAYQELTLGTDGYVAVRSSGVIEDTSDDALAGINASFLFVKGEINVVIAFKECVASFYSNRALEHRHQHGYGHDSGLAVVFQRMADALVAGVVFSQHPVTHDPRFVEVSAVLGAGEMIVSGRETGDTYLVDTETWRITDRNICPQGRMLVRNTNPNGDGATSHMIEIGVPESLNQLPKLYDHEIIELARMAKQVNTIYGGQPHEMEYALDQQRHIWYVQARPITVQADDVDYGDPPTDETAQLLFKGSGGSPGVGVGEIIFLRTPEDMERVDSHHVAIIEFATPDWDPVLSTIKGLITLQGSRTSHSAIICRQKGTPAVMGATDALDHLQDGDLVTVNGLTGQVFQGRAERHVAWNEEHKARQAEHLEQMRHVRTQTRVYAILDEPRLAAQAAADGFEGVGLARAEAIMKDLIGVHPQIFIDSGREEEYIQAVVDAILVYCAAFGRDATIVYRLTDHKTVEYKELRGADRYEKEEINPMIGFRGATRYLKRSEAFAMECEALRRVREQYPNLTVMIPFVRTSEELSHVLDELALNGVMGNIWMMVELGINVLHLHEFIRVGRRKGLTGLSIGSNDLRQTVFALDRENPLIQDVADEVHPAMLDCYELVIKAGIAAGLTVGFCGQAPSDFPELVEPLVRWGITSISVMPDALARTRANVLKTERKLNLVAA